MTAYRSFAAGLALAALAACSSGPPHPDGWTQSAAGTWTTVSGAGTETYTYSATPTTGSLTDLASSQAVDTVEQNRGSRLVRSVPFSGCPAEAGLATYTLARGRVLEIAFSVNNGQAIVAKYERPAAVADAPAALAALRQAVCYAL